MWFAMMQKVWLHSVKMARSISGLILKGAAMLLMRIMNKIQASGLVAPPMDTDSISKMTNNFISTGMYDDVDRVLLCVKPEGIYIFVYLSPSSKFPEKDYLEDDLEIAKEACLEGFGIPLNCWTVYDGPMP